MLPVHPRAGRRLRWHAFAVADNGNARSSQQEKISGTCNSISGFGSARQFGDFLKRPMKATLRRGTCLVAVRITRQVVPVCALSAITLCFRHEKQLIGTNLLMRIRECNRMQIGQYLEYDVRVVLPLGGTEQHDLSLSVNSILAEHVAQCGETTRVPVFSVIFRQNDDRCMKIQ